jgi:hypothetical protein
MKPTMMPIQVRILPRQLPRQPATTACSASISNAIRHHITCDALPSPVFVDGSIPISVGRNQRMIPQRTRLLVLLRDQACTFPGCNETHHLEVHHIMYWEHDGPTGNAATAREPVPTPPQPVPGQLISTTWRI